MAPLLALLPRAVSRTFFGAGDIVSLALRRISHRPGFAWGRTLYATSLFVVIAILVGRSSSGEDFSRFGAPDLPRYGRYVFIVLAVTQLGVAFFGPSVMIAHALAQERRRGTIGLLLLTHRNPAHVVRGILTSRLLLLVAILLGGTPIASIAAMLGGVSSGDIVLLTLGSLAAAILSASIGALVGADLAPRIAPAIAFVVSICCLWLMTHGFAALFILFVTLQKVMPGWALIAALSGLALPPLLLLHGFLTRRAGLALVHRFGEPVVALKVAPPPRPRKPPPKKSELPAMLAPELQETPVRPLVYLPAAAIVMTLGLALLPDDASWPWLGTMSRALRGLSAMGGFILAAALTLGASVYPALRLAAFRSDATLVIVALAPLRIGSMLQQLERRLLRILVAGLVVAAALVAPLALLGGSDGPSRYVVAWLLHACFLLAMFYLSFRIGAGVRSTFRAIGTMIVLWAILVASLLVAAIFGTVTIHPLALPIAYAVSRDPAPLLMAQQLMLLPLAIALRASARRRMQALWREPYADLADEVSALG